MPVELAAMAAIANVQRAARTTRAYLERDVARPRELSAAGFLLLFNPWVRGPMQTRQLARSMGCARFPSFNRGEAALTRDLDDDEKATLARLLRRVVRAAATEEDEAGGSGLDGAAQPQRGGSRWD
jgi:hypothetical protein